MIVALIILSVVLFWDLWLMAMAMIKQADLEAELAFEEERRIIPFRDDMETVIGLHGEEQS